MTCLTMYSTAKFSIAKPYLNPACNEQKNGRGHVYNYNGYAMQEATAVAVSVQFKVEGEF